MVKNKVVLKKAGLDFWEGVERNPIDFHSHVHKNTCQTWGGEMIVHVPRNSRHEGM